MSRNIAVGIDIGTHQTKVVVATSANENKGGMPRVIGIGQVESKGLRHGYVSNQGEVVKGLKAALKQAEKSSGEKIKKAFLAVGGAGLTSFTTISTISSPRPDSEISELDVQNIEKVATHEIPQQYALNRKILHTIPLQYKIDGKPVLGRPQGMKGSKLEVKMLFISCPEQNLNDLIDAVNECDVEIEDVMASPLAASLVSLTRAQKIAGCVLANIGAETVSIVVFENDIPISLEIFPFGSNDITNDIALGFKIPLEKAENIKINDGEEFPKKKLDEIIEARLSDIFELIEAHLKKIGRNGLLPAGIIITGGGSGLTTIEDLAKNALKLPSKKSEIKIDSTKGQMKDATWAVSYGLCVLGFNTDESGSVTNKLGLRFVNSTRNSIWGWMKQFLP